MIRPIAPMTAPMPIPALAPVESDGEEDTDEADEPAAVVAAAKADEEVEEVTLATSLTLFVVLAPEELTISFGNVVDVPGETLIVAGSLIGVVGAAESGVVAGVEAGVAWWWISAGDSMVKNVLLNTYRWLRIWTEHCRVPNHADHNFSSRHR